MALETVFVPSSFARTYCSLTFFSSNVHIIPGMYDGSMCINNQLTSIPGILISRKSSVSAVSFFGFVTFLSSYIRMYIIKRC